MTLYVDGEWSGSGGRNLTRWLSFRRRVSVAPRASTTTRVPLRLSTQGRHLQWKNASERDEQSRPCTTAVIMRFDIVLRIDRKVVRRDPFDHVVAPGLDTLKRVELLGIEPHLQHLAARRVRPLTFTCGGLGASISPSSSQASACSAFASMRS